VNTYDPSDSIVYVRMPRETDSFARPVTSTASQYRLPYGYANRSARTRLK
jgi:hypothetical protein